MNLQDLPLRFRSKVEIDENNCWLWTASKRRGYAMYWNNRRQNQGHVFAYNYFYGEVLAGLCIDHLCRVRHCVNPHHLEPVTLRENILRGEGFAAQQAKMTHCKYGHEFTEENVYLYKNMRHCRVCRKVKQRKEYMNSDSKEEVLRSNAETQ